MDYEAGSTRWVRGVDGGRPSRTLGHGTDLAWVLSARRVQGRSARRRQSHAQTGITHRIQCSRRLGCHIVWDSTDYELDWPNSLVRAELLALCSHRHRSWSADEIELLLTEAFHTEVPAADYRQVSAFTAWADDSRQGQDWINAVSYTHLTLPTTPYV